MSAESKKLNLAFLPYTTATSPPLGICMLKSYIERNLRDWQVQTIDLNLLELQRTFKLITRRRLYSNEEIPQGLLGEIVLSQASQVFRKKDSYEFYYRPDRYTVYADFLLEIYRNHLKDAQVLREAYLRQKPLPALVNALADLLLQGNPDAVGLSICYNQQLWLGLCIGKAIKERSKVPVILGGTFFNSEPGAIFSRFHQSMDYLVSGEGEEALTSLLKNLEDPKETPGLTFSKNGEVVSSPGIFTKELDALGHPDFRGLDLNGYYSPSAIVPILTSRGCYWRKCAFCVHYKSSGLTYRTHSIDYVIDELKSHIARGITNFSFIDEMISPAHFSKLADGIIAAGLDINYFALAKPVKQFNLDLLQKIAKSGCKYLLWGVESGNQRILDLMEKGTVVSDVETVLQSAFQAGLYNHAYIIAGFPTETREEFAQTIQFLNRNRNAIYAVHRGTFTLDRNSPVYDNPEKFSITRTWQDPNVTSFNRFNFECSQGMTREEASDAFTRALPFLRAFNPYSKRLDNYRDHALLIYSNPDSPLKPDLRPFPETITI